MSIFKKLFILILSLISALTLYACHIDIENLKDELIEKTTYTFTNPDKSTSKITKPFTIENEILKLGQYSGKDIFVIYRLKDKTDSKYFQIVGSRVNVAQPEDGKEKLIKIVAKITFDNRIEFSYELLFKVLPKQGDFYKITLPESVKVITPGINLEQIRENTYLELEVTVPENKEVALFEVNDVDYLDSLIDNKIGLTIKEDIVVKVEFKDKDNENPQPGPNPGPNPSPDPNPAETEFEVEYSKADLNLVGGQISAENKAKKDSVLEFEIIQKAEKALKKLTINGLDKTSTVNNNKFKIKITKKTTISVEYEAIQMFDVEYSEEELSLKSGKLESGKASKGTVLKFLINAKPEHKIKALLINGQNKTSLIKYDNTFEITVNKKITLKVEYEKINSSPAKHDGFRRANTAILSENAKKYYQGINFNTKNPGELLRQLRELTMRKHTNVVNYEYAKKLGEIDKLDSGKAWSIYDNIEYSTAWGNGGHPWNREHVWPNSYMGVQKHSGKNSKGVDSDLHNLRVLTTTLNSKRNNSYYKEGSGQGDGNATWFYPGDDHIGDVSRIIAYMLTRYDWLKVTTEKPGANAYGGKKENAKMGDVRNFINFHTKDPVTVFEQNRNERIARIQGNRNPFIDFPQFTEIIYKHYMKLANISLMNKKISSQVQHFMSTIFEIQHNYFNQTKQTIFA